MEQTKKMRQYAQDLRKNATREERHLWYDFLKTYHTQFHRQYVIDNYIVDFYCYKAKLAIELDGSQHYEPQEVLYDQRRTSDLLAKGIKVLRFTNLDVRNNFYGVCQAIDEEVGKRMSEI